MLCREFLRKHSLNGGAFRLAFALWKIVRFSATPCRDVWQGVAWGRLACLFFELCNKRPLAVAVKSDDSARYLRDVVVLEWDDDVSVLVDNALL